MIIIVKSRISFSGRLMVKYVFFVNEEKIVGKG